LAKRIDIEAFMKIKKVQLTDKDKRKALKSAVRKAVKESGLEKITVSKIYRNRRKYTRKGKKQEFRDEELAG